MAGILEDKPGYSVYAQYSCAYYLPYANGVGRLGYGFPVVTSDLEHMRGTGNGILLRNGFRNGSAKLLRDT